MMKNRRLEELLDHYVDQRLSATDQAELEALLLESQEARRQFWARMEFESLIEEAVAAHRVSDWMTQPERDSLQRAGSSYDHRSAFSWWRKLSPVWSVGLAAAVVIAVATAGTALLRKRVAPEEMTTGIAKLTSLWNVQWPDGQTPVNRGAVLKPGRLQISAGVAGIEFYNGVKMTLEGPADIVLSKVDEAICRLGKIRVLVPNATRQFRVVTDRADVLDLGTEFGMDIREDDLTEIHVFDGKIEWIDRTDASPTRIPQELNAGNAIRLDESGFSTLSARPDSFMSRDQLVSLVRAALDERHRAWQLVSRQLQSDPRTLLYFDFDRESMRSGAVANLAVSTGGALDGTLIGCEQTQGRWPERRGLQFKQPGDRVRVFVPGEYDKLTYFMWARVDRLPRDHVSLFLTDGFEAGETHWQIFQGRVRLGIGDAKIGDAKGRSDTVQLRPLVQSARYGVNYDSPLQFSDTEEGSWCQLAVVIDTLSGDVQHYYNGRKVSESKLELRQKLQIGYAELGNWGFPAATDRQPIRNFDGRIDEFIIFQDALSEDEIWKLYTMSGTSPAG